MSDITRAALVAAVAEILDEATKECVPAHRDIGKRVADRLGLPADVAEADTDPAPAEGERYTDSTDRDSLALPDWHPRGRALFWRSWTGWGDTPTEAAEAYADCFDWACCPVLWRDKDPDGEAAGRRPNRHAEIYQVFAARSIPWWGMVFCSPADFEAELRDAVAFCAAHGAVGLVLDVERPFRDVPRSQVSRLARFARKLCDDAGLKLGFTSYGGRGYPRVYKFKAWLAHCNGITVPQHYDRDLAFDPDYPAESQARYHAAGAKHIVAGVGLRAYKKAKEDQEGIDRTKKPGEVRRHLEIIDAETWCAWGRVDRLPEDVLEVLQAA